MTRKYLITVGTFGFLAIIFGSILYNLLKGKLTDEHYNDYQVGLQYMMYHTVALLALAFTGKSVSESFLNFVYAFFVFGNIFFSFGMIVQATSEYTDLSLGFMSFLIPMGGMSFIVGWSYIGWMGLTGGYKKRTHHVGRRKISSKTSHEDERSSDF
jgi:uncharacterized membrane protein YgdD (TMEM256/DUF423 family)